MLRRFTGLLGSRIRRARPIFSSRSVHSCASFVCHPRGCNPDLWHASHTIQRRSFAKKPPKTQQGGNNVVSLQLQGVTKRLQSGRVLLDNASMSFLERAKIGVVGNNGSGKSTLLKILAGVDADFSGDRVVYSDKRVGYLPQEPVLDPDKNVLGNVMEGVGHIQDLLAEFEDIAEQFADPEADFDALLARQAEVQELIDAADGWDLEYRIRRNMAALNCPAGYKPIDALSGGEQRRIALCRLLISEPDILLLDEPTNHLDAQSVLWLEQYLEQYKGTVIAITHDRYFLENVCEWILEVSLGKLYAYEGCYSQYLQKKSERLARDDKANKRARESIRRELNWSRSRRTGQQKVGKARHKALNKAVAEQEQAKQSRRIEATTSLMIPQGVPLTSTPVLMEGVGLSFEDHRPIGKHQKAAEEQDLLAQNNTEVTVNTEEYTRHIIQGLNFRINPNDRIGVIGPNGVGKTTFVRVLAGLRPPTAGDVTHHPKLSLGMNAQQRDQDLSEDNSVLEEICGREAEVMLRPEGPAMNRHQYAAQFNFHRNDQNKMVSSCSGGERNRIALAKSLAPGCNMLILDEPTNDLDVDTLRALEEGLGGFGGAVLIVSHDRWFLDRVCNKLIVFYPLSAQTDHLSAKARENPSPDINSNWWDGLGPHEFIVQEGDAESGRALVTLFEGNFTAWAQGKSASQVKNALGQDAEFKNIQM